jgi:signal transduction histidine kinase
MSLAVQEVVPAQLVVEAPRSGRRLLGAWRWEIAVSGVALAAAVAAVWITLRANFLAYPGWLAVQKADFILGPIGVGLYWRHRRPNNRLGLLLIALGLVGIPYILESSAAPALFGIGTMWEAAIYVMTSLVILAYPSGRLDGRAERLIITLGLGTGVLTYVALQVTSPHYTPGFSISGCHGACPANGLAIWSTPSWWPALADFGGVVLIAVPLATAAVLVWRFVTGSPPRRRATAIGAPVAVLFLLMQATYRTIFLVSPNGLSPGAQPVQGVIQWTIAGARSFIWYGFLFALIAAELYAGRVLRPLLRNALAHPSLRELEQTLREPLGDPSLRLGFWRTGTSQWIGADGTPLRPAGPGQSVTQVDRDGQPAATIVHDEQLADDPELLRAAGAVALLALENAELELAWKESLRHLADSRERLTRASDRERRKLERDLHDGAQQRLVATIVRISIASELATDKPDLHSQLTQARQELEEAIHQLRELAHGIYPTELADYGLAGALRAIPRRLPAEVSVSEASDRRFRSEIEAALYYCCLEAVQNVTKHAGPNAHATIRLHVDSDELRLEVSDNGPGFDLTSASGGMGLQNMRDRLGAIGGHTEIISKPGRGTLVKAAVPLNTLDH